jgi:23S rRNA pseudouridine1911/1915/1917 synthase
MNTLPVICHETEDFAVVFKPPRMHCAPLRQNGKENETLLDWYAKSFPPVMELSGRKDGEGGLLHRLDFETQGLVLFAKNQKTLENLLNQQKQGLFAKEYSAICQKRESQPEAVALPPPVIESYFRPYGPGRKQVRPVIKEKLKGKEVAKDGDSYYKTEVIGVKKKQADNMEFYLFTIKLLRGFRHQIRCHLAWVGFPVLNDPLYGKGDCDGFLALRATGLFFNDPRSNEPVRFSVEALKITNLTT